MVLNDSFASLFASPASLKKANDTFNESFGDKNTLSAATIFRILHREHDQISSILKVSPPTTSQYQNSLNELISLYERAEDQSTFGFQKLVLSVFLKLAANILNGLGKPKYQPTLYRLSQLIAASIIPDIGDDNVIEEKNMQKWADRIVIESAIHLLDFPNYHLELDFSIENIVDDLVLASGRFQFVKSSIFEAARDIATELDITEQIDAESRFSQENLEDESFLILLIWLFLRQKSILKNDFLPKLLPKLRETPSSHEYIHSGEFSLLDVKLYLVSLSVVSSTSTESGTTAKSPPVVASQLSLTKTQRDCWKFIVDKGTGKSISALGRLRTSQFVEAVRLIQDGSEDVRVLFEAWKHCLQPSATYDDDVYETIQVFTEKYTTKMNGLLAYGPSYSCGTSSFTKSNSTSRRDIKALFPLQFDYEFVNTTEAEHIGTVINSLEGYMSPQQEEQAEDEDVLQINDSFGDDTFHSFGTASDQISSGNNSQFFSPMKHNRDSMMPSAISQLIRDESLANTSHISTKSLIMTPTRSATFNPSPKSVLSESNTSVLSIERLQSAMFSTPPRIGKDTDDTVDDEMDELEVALLESIQNHEKSILAPKTPEKPPQRDAQTETDDVVTSSGESEVTVKYTPRSSTERERNVDIYSSESEEECQDEDEEEDYEEYEDEEENEVEEDEDEDEDDLNESQVQDLIDQLLEATSTMFRDRQMKKFGIISQKIQTENTSDSDILRSAERKLAKISTDLAATYERLEKLRNPCVTTVITHTAQPSHSTMQLIGSSEVDHDSRKCIGCQSDEIQEAALRRLEQMALDWDAEGNDYLYEK